MELLVCKRVLFPENDQSEKDMSKAQENHGIKGTAAWEKSHSAVRTRTRNIKNLKYSVEKFSFHFCATPADSSDWAWPTETK